MEIRSIDSFLDYWEGVRARTRRVAACIPEDRIEWSYEPGRFTLGDLVRHLAAIERYMYAETVSGRPSAYAGCGRDLADGRDEGASLRDAPSFERGRRGNCNDDRGFYRNS